MPWMGGCRERLAALRVMEEVGRSLVELGEFTTLNTNTHKCTHTHTHLRGSSSLPTQKSEEAGVEKLTNGGGRRSKAVGGAWGACRRS